jgi:putative transposase
MHGDSSSTTTLTESLPRPTAAERRAFRDRAHWLLSDVQSRSSYAIPNNANVLGLALKDAHGRYASYWNAMRCSSGHVWQGRYYSCPLDESHLWEALRHTELNAVRASMVAKAEGWGWSGAADHCGSASAGSWLGMELWRRRWSAAGWREYLEAGESRAALAAIRHNTRTGRPLGSAEFLRSVEGQTKRRLALQKRGPRRVAEPGKSQGAFSFGA